MRSAGRLMFTELMLHLLHLLHLPCPEIPPRQGVWVPAAPPPRPPPRLAHNPGLQCGPLRCRGAGVSASPRDFNHPVHAKQYHTPNRCLGTASPDGLFIQVPLLSGAKNMPHPSLWLQSGQHLVHHALPVKAFCKINAMSPGAMQAALNKRLVSALIHENRRMNRPNSVLPPQ